MRDSTHEMVKSLWHFTLSTIGCSITGARGVAWLIPALLFIYFLRAYLRWVEDEGDEVTYLIEEIKQMLKDNPPQILEEDKPKVSERDMKDYYEYKSRRRRRARR